MANGRPRRKPPNLDVATSEAQTSMDDIEQPSKKRKLNDESAFQALPSRTASTPLTSRPSGSRMQTAKKSAPSTGMHSRSWPTDPAETESVVSRPKQTARVFDAAAIAELEARRPGSLTKQERAAMNAARRARGARPLQTARKWAPSTGPHTYARRRTASTQADNEDEGEDPAKTNIPARRSKSTTTAASPAQPIHISGTYAVETSADESFFHDYNDSSTVTIVQQGDETWGSVNFGHFGGIMCFPRGSQGPNFNFSWRGEDTWENKRFQDDKSQTGEMTFWTDGVVKGTFRGLKGKCTFEGQRDRDQSMERLKRKWKSYKRPR